MNMIYPLIYIKITQYLHPGNCLDFGWSNSYGGKTAQVYAVADGIVYKARYNTIGGIKLPYDLFRDNYFQYNILVKIETSNEWFVIK